MSIIPGASAMTAAKTAEIAAENTAAICPELDSIGAVGDAFCNPYFITDFGTMDVDPAEITYKVASYDENGNKVSPENGTNFILSDGEDNTTINTDYEQSRLMKYIVFCGERSSPFGMADQNIANELSRQSGTLESQIPIWGSIADILQGSDVLENFGLVSGEACVTRNSGNLGSDVFTWEEASYYQRYIEDQRIAESEGLIEKSSVAIALEEYYEQNPIDQSFEGILAYKTGMTKEKVSDTIALVQGLMWIAQYDPADFYPLGPEIIEEAPQISFENDNIKQGNPLFRVIMEPEIYINKRMDYTISI